VTPTVAAARADCVEPSIAATSRNAQATARRSMESVTALSIKYALKLCETTVNIVILCCDVKNFI
jgi:hypothetical protein